jgi:hypothetical protein
MESVSWLGGQLSDPKSYIHVRIEVNPGIYEPVKQFVSQKMSRKVAKITWIKSEQNGT